MIKVEIDGKIVEIKPGSMIIEAVDQARAEVPRFCYHKKLSIAANCRMCLVEVEKIPKPVPACATPVTDGMKVFTQSKVTRDAQRSVMEFLLINHPLDCPICDQGGECELQDNSMGYGFDNTRFDEQRRVVEDKDIGPLISTDLTRCIHCTRCVRFTEEIAGYQEFGMLGRGEHSKITTFLNKAVESELSGNVIDLCPVGALTSKPYRFTARGWELSEKSSIAAHDCVASNISIHTRRNDVMRVVPRTNEDLNEVWLSDRDRFSYTAINHNNRIQKPKVKKGGKFVEVSWQEALESAAVIMKQINRDLGVLASPNSTTEELYLLQKIIKGLECHNIDHRVRQKDFRYQEAAPEFISLGGEVKDLEEQEHILLIGSYINKEQPILGHKVRKASTLDCEVSVINPMDFNFNFDIKHNIISNDGNILQLLYKLLKSVLSKNHTYKLPESLEHLLETIKTSDRFDKLADDLMSEKTQVILGTLIESSAIYSEILAVASHISKATNSNFGVLTSGVNSAGAWLTGCIPHRNTGGKSSAPGLDAYEIQTTKLAGYVLYGLDPELDCIASKSLMKNLQGSKVIAFASFMTDSLSKFADIILPISTYAENDGSYINICGMEQSFNAAITPKFESKPGWKVLTALSQMMEQKFTLEFDELKKEIQEQIGIVHEMKPWKGWFPSKSVFTSLSEGHLALLPLLPLNSSDMLVRHATCLQHTKDVAGKQISMNQKTLENFNLKNKQEVKVEGVDGETNLNVNLQDNVPDNCAIITVGSPETNVLANSFSVKLV